MIYIWRILDTFFRFDAWYHYLHISRIADDIFYGKVKGAMWQIGSSLGSTTSVCGSVPKDWLWSYMEIRKDKGTSLLVFILWRHGWEEIGVSKKPQRLDDFKYWHYPFWCQPLSLFCPWLSSIEDEKQELLDTTLLAVWPWKGLELGESGIWYEPDIQYFKHQATTDTLEHSGTGQLSLLEVTWRIS